MASGPDSVRALLILINEATTSALAQYEKHGAPVPSLDDTSLHPLDQTQDVLEIRKLVRTIEGACDQLCATLAPPVTSVINRAQNLDWLGLRVAVQVKIADILAEHPAGLHTKKLGELVGIDPAKLSRIMRLLASKHVFRETNDNVFSNNRLSMQLLSSNNTSSLVYLDTTYAATAAAVFVENLTDQRTRFSQETTNSAFMQAVQIEGTFYNWLQVNPREQKEFAYAMGGLGNAMGSLSVLHHFPWSHVSTLCDVGSGIGSFSLPLAKIYPSINITLFDSSQVIEQARKHWEQKLSDPVDERINFVVGDFFEGITPQNQDVYYLRNITHNWPDADALKILTNVCNAMGPNSSLLLRVSSSSGVAEQALMQINSDDYVLQSLVPSSNAINGTEKAPSPLLPNYGGGIMRSHYLDIRMLLLYNAKERTFDELVTLGKLAGLKFEKIWDMADTSIMEFTRDKVA